MTIILLGLLAVVGVMWLAIKSLFQRTQELTRRVNELSGHH